MGCHARLRRRRRIGRASGDQSRWWRALRWRWWRRSRRVRHGRKRCAGDHRHYLHAGGCGQPLVLLQPAAGGGMSAIYYDVDTALSKVPVNVAPLTDDTDFKSLETAVAYNASGMALYWHFVTSNGN